MLPFILKPAFKEYLWGGDKLKRFYNKQTDLDIVAESWELSVYSGSESVIASGELAGMSMREFSRKYPVLLGTNSGINILVKLIDAKLALSVQVHPGDDYARRVERDFGKTEVWHVLESEPESFLYYGFSRDTTRLEVEDRIKNNTIEEILQKVYVKPKDTFFIPAGTIHAIGKGLVIAEIQQSSDSTYRVYDFDRRGADGKPRDLHIKKALDVLSYEPAVQNAENTVLSSGPGYTLIRLAICEYFTADRLELDGEWTNKTSGKYLALVCTTGEAVLKCGGKLNVFKGDCVFIPADNACFSLSGNGVFLIASQY